VVIAAGQDGALAIRPNGTIAWKSVIGTSILDSTPSIAMDGSGKAYVGSGDGTVPVLSTRGKTLRAISAGPASSSSKPICVIGPGGHLIVSGTDGILRIYF
jgi:outer membrane protein assembly factor BamB